MSQSRSTAYACAALSGALLAFSFPSFGHPAAAWVALTPLLVILHGTRSPGLAFGLGLTTGAVHFAGTLPWLTQVMTEFAGVPLPVGVAINGLLVAYLALFPAAFAVSLALLCARLGGWGLLGAAPVWLTTELGRLWLFGGFPWELLGYSQTTVLPVAQLASVFGAERIRERGIDQEQHQPGRDPREVLQVRPEGRPEELPGVPGWQRPGGRQLLAYEVESPQVECPEVHPVERRVTREQRRRAVDGDHASHHHRDR